MSRGARGKLKSCAPRLVRSAAPVLEFRSTNAMWLMCVMIAFGLGIDKKDVRFVLHHSVRPLDLYYVSGHT